MKRHAYETGKTSTKEKELALKCIVDGDRILDIGCGDCEFFRMIKKECTLIGMDINLEYADDRYTVFDDLKKINGEFDVITMFDVLEHLDPEKRDEYINWINNHLKPDGYLIISIPNIDNIYMLRNFWDNPEHKRPYTITAIKRLFDNYEIEEKKIMPFINPLKILRCWLTGTSFYTTVCYVMRKKY